MAPDIPQIAVGDLVQLRKAHPCGGDTWRVTRVGADIGLQCATCGRRVMLDRLVAERRIRRTVEKASVPSEERKSGPPSLEGGT
jgi:hypothetical protein